MHQFKLRSITEPCLSMKLSFLFLLSFPVTMVQIVHPQHTVCIQWSHGQLVKALGLYPLRSPTMWTTMHLTAPQVHSVCFTNSQLGSMQRPSRDRKSIDYYYYYTIVVRKASGIGFYLKRAQALVSC